MKKKIYIWYFAGCDLHILMIWFMNSCFYNNEDMFGFVVTVNWSGLFTIGMCFRIRMYQISIMKITGECTCI